MNDPTVKDLALRHDPHYLKRRPKLLQYLRLSICVVLLGAAFIWFGAKTSAKDNLPYSKGPFSSSHASFANQCDLCHSDIVRGQRKKGLLQKTSNEACMTCHEAPDHQMNQVKAKVPACGECHVEHRGLVQQVQTPDAQCVKCHGQERLATTDVPSAHRGHPDHPWHRWPFKAVTGFDQQHHPKFSAETGEFNNSTTIAFSHAAHLNLKDAQGRPLQCGDCHRPVAQTGDAWKYSYLTVASAVASSGQAQYPDNGRALMSMPKYEQSCATGPCHDLSFAAKIKRLEHPKSKLDLPNLPTQIQARIEEYFRQPDNNRMELCANGPLKLCLNNTQSSSERKMVEKPEESSAKTVRGRVEQALADAKMFVWNARCRLCHQADSPASHEATPATVPTWKESDWKDSALVSRFMPYAVFSHQAHSSVQCEGCHILPSEPACCLPPKPDVVAQSHDIHMPGIATCEKCHSGSPPEAGHTENGCFLCHQYHPWNPSREMFRGQHTIQELIGWTPPRPKEEAER